ncbi:MAG: exosome complex exonuclease Rrp41 [Candidatus Micrarchaeota archaeon]|nr:exosome complex exonuclease Rrp41 [Candidatus Micrarchaeota archaeon]
MVEKKDLFVNGKRLDGRGPEDLRPLKITAGVLHRAQGSALIEWGRNKVMAAVYGPREVFPKHLANPTKAIINARYIMAPFSGQEEHGRSGPNRRSIEISKVAKHVFENAILVEQFPKTQIDVHMEVLQSDGGTRVAGITAGAVALADAGIPMRDMPAGLSAGTVGEQLLLDLDKYEDNLGDSDIPTVILPRTGEILLSQMDGMLSKPIIEGAFDMIFRNIHKIREKQVEALQKSYEKVQDSVLEGEVA